MPRGTREHYPRLLEHFNYGTFTLYGSVFQHFHLYSSHYLGDSAEPPNNAPQHQITNAGRLPVTWFGLIPFRSPLLRESRLLYIPEGNEMVQFPSFATIPYVFRYGYQSITSDGLPHSEIPGSKCAYHSPRLIAVSHVLHRLHVPRHPPCALTCLTLISI